MIGAINSSNINVLVAFGGGIISILSPCVLPMVPGYLSLVTGLTVTELEGGEHRHLVRIATMTGLFALGFGVVFTILGLALTSIGQTAFRNQETLTRVSGLVVFAMALYLAGSQFLRVPQLYPEKRFQVSDRFGMLTAPIAGAAFAFGWSPCLGPVMAALIAAGSNETGFRPLSLFASYAAGLGVAFLLIGLAFGRWATPLNFVKRHMKTLTLASATVLGIFGLLLIFDRLWWINRELITALDSIGLDWLAEKLG